jgi:hypothetical protein
MAAVPVSLEMEIDGWTECFRKGRKKDHDIWIEGSRNRIGSLRPGHEELFIFQSH